MRLWKKNRRFPYPFESVHLGSGKRHNDKAGRPEATNSPLQSAARRWFMCSNGITLALPTRPRCYWLC
jgi:hypothetical protein